jgi:hypothetical protein
VSRGPLRIRWADAFIPEDDWYAKEDFTYEQRVMETVGWVILQDRDYWAVAGTYDQDAELYCNVILIPRGCIQGVPELVELHNVDSGGADADGVATAG